MTPTTDPDAADPTVSIDSAVRPAVRKRPKPGERRVQILQTLARTGGKKSKAAEMLGLPRSNFSRLLKTMNIH